MAKILVMVYQEGASGISAVSQLGGNVGLRSMTNDANCIIDTLKSLGNDVYVCDVYQKGRDVFDKACSCNAEKVKTSDLGALCESGLDGVILSGIHAKNGSEKSFASYTVNDVAWHEYTLNGTVYGDIGIAAVFFGRYGVPILCVTGDRGACLEAKELLDGVETAELKISEQRNVSKLLPEGQAKTVLVEKTESSLSLIGKIQPVRVNGPYVIRVKFNRVDFCDECLYWRYGVVTRTAPMICERKIEKIENYNDLIF